jgi:hypothetical protein
MADNLAYAGRVFRIEFAKLNDGSIPALDFLSGQKPQHRARLFVLFTKMGDTGRIHNREHFRKLDGEFWEFKNFQIRMPCYFRPDRRVVVTHGFIKKKDSTDPSELRRAKSIKEAYDRIVGQ